MATSYGNPERTRSHGNGLAVAGLVCGIVGIFFANFILGPLAVIFGGVGLRNARAQGAGKSGMAIAGIVLGAIDIVLFVVMLVIATTHGGIHWYVGS